MKRSTGVVIPGVEEPLPPGETLLWHGRPSARALARHAFHLPTLAAYFAVLVAVRVLVVGGASPLALAAYVGVSVVALLVFGGVSLWVARSTVYAITSRRVVMKVGMAMPMTLNVPLRCVESAGLRQWRDGTGEIALALGGTDRFAYFVLWPHARPWHLLKPEPALRGLTDVVAVGALLRGAVEAASRATGGESGREAVVAVAPEIPVEIPVAAMRPARVAAMAGSR